MVETFIVSFIGEASPNDIHQLAAITHENQGKWLVSKVNFIDNQVAAVIKIEVPAENKPMVIDAFRDQQNLITSFSETSAQTESNQEQHCQLRLDANDRAGIVNDITHLLDSQRIRVVDLNCQRIFIAGHDGVSSALFTSNISLKIPPNLSIYDVVNELEALSEDIKVRVEE